MGLLKINNKIIFFLILFLIINSISIYALGVSPGRFRVNFEPNKEYTKDVCFKAEGRNHMILGTSGETGQYITVEDKEIITQADEWICTKYTLKMPKKFDTPGLHKGGVYAVEKVPEGSGMVIIRVKVTHQVWIDSPYPGKYLLINSFVAKNSNAGSKIPIIIKTESKGDETIGIAQGTITIYDYQDNELETIKTNIVTDIKTNDKKTFLAEWDPKEHPIGNYKAHLVLKYDSNQTEADTTFKIGGIDANIIDYQKEVIIGGIKEFSVVADSIWSENLDVKTKVDIYNYSEERIRNNRQIESLASFETLTERLPPWGKGKLTGYIDTSKLELGNYTIKMNLMFEGEQKESYGRISIINPPEEKKEKTSFVLNTQVIMIILGFLLIIMIGVLVFLLIPKKKKKK